MISPCLPLKASSFYGRRQPKKLRQVWMARASAKQLNRVRLTLPSWF